MDETEYKRYYGIMEYFATGEGVTNIYYVDRATSKEQFREKFIKECNIDPYFQIGIEIFDEINDKTPNLIFQYWKALKDGAGFMKFSSHLNYS